MTPDLVLDFIAEGNYTDADVARWAARYPKLSGRFREAAHQARIGVLVGTETDAYDAYLPPYPEDEMHCWD